MKIKKEFLKKVWRNGSACTKKFYYKCFDYSAANEKGEFFRFSIIKRINIDYMDTTKYLEKENWEIVARTEDGKTFMRF